MIAAAMKKEELYVARALEYAKKLTFADYL